MALASNALLDELRIVMEKKKKAAKMKEELQQELQSRVSKLSSLSLAFCQQKKECKSTQQQIAETKSNQSQYEKRLADCDKYTQINHHNNLLLKERKKCLEMYQIQLHSIYLDCEQKFKSIDMQSTVINSKRRLCCFQLCTIFFDTKFTCFNYLNSIQRVLNKYEQVSSFEEKINAGLGYYGLLVLQVAEIYDINLKHKITYKGCRTNIQRENGEIHNLYFLKKDDVKKLRETLSYFIQDIYQIFDSLNLSKKCKQQDILYLLHVLSTFLYSGEVLLPEE